MEEVDVHELFQVVGYGRLGEVEALRDGGTLGPFRVIPDVLEHLDAVGIPERLTHPFESFRIEFLIHDTNVSMFFDITMSAGRQRTCACSTGQGGCGQTAPSRPLFA